MLLAHLMAATAAGLIASAPDAPPPPTSEPAPAAESAAVNGPAIAPPLAAGMPVRDRSGAMIGSVQEVSSDEDGKQTATIRMGAGSFAIDAASLSVRDGAAQIDATEAELKAQAISR